MPIYLGNNKITSIYQNDKKIKAYYGDNLVYQSQAENTNIFGVQWAGGPDPKWVRTDDSASFSDPVPYVPGATVYGSPFDNIMPWKGIKRETLPTGDVMVKIPKFWFQRYLEEGKEFIKIANYAAPDFTVHPAFTHAGVETDCIYVGAYEYTEKGSVSRQSAWVGASRDNFRGVIRGKGVGWGLMDISAWSAIQMLFLVEYATYNSQAAIGLGNTSGLRIITGSCDNVPGLTGYNGTNGQIGVIYRGIENPWGNVSEYVDGVIATDYDCYVCNDPSKYTDWGNDGYVKCVYLDSTDPKRRYIVSNTLSSDDVLKHIFLPNYWQEGWTAATSDTYVCDGLFSNITRGRGWITMAHGGMSSDGSYAGLFAANISIMAGYGDASTGVRLLYIPS